MKYKVLKKGISQREGNRLVEREVGKVIDVAEPGASRFVARGLIEPFVGVRPDEDEGRKGRRARRRAQEASEVSDD